MIKHAWTVICEKSIIDRETNNISLDVLEQLNIKLPPIPSEAKGVFFPKKIEAISLWYRNFEEKGIKGEGQLKIETSDGNIIGSVNIKIDLSNTHRHRTRVRLDGLPIPKGTSNFLYFITELKSNDTWVEVARSPLEININQ